MELTTSQAKEILIALGGKYLPGKGSAVAQAEKLMQEKKVVFKDGKLLEDGSTDKDETTPTAVTPATPEKNENKKGKTYKILVNVLHNKVRYLENEEHKLDEETADLFIKHSFAELIK